MKKGVAGIRVTEQYIKNVIYLALDLSLSSFVLSSVFVTAFLPKDFIISMNDCPAFLALAAAADCSPSPFSLFCSLVEEFSI